MIPKEAFIALAALMASAWVFGIVCDRLLTHWLHDRSEATQDLSADHDRWENDPVPTIPCESCKHQETSMREEPCSGCLSGTRGSKPSKWEAR